MVLAGVGLCDSIYLTINAFFPQVSLVCPTTGPIDCGALTSSTYSKLLGIVPVALLGLLWFAAVLLLVSWRPSWYPYAIVLLWVASMVMVGYLVSVEALIIHKICLYCTLAHACTVFLGIPILKLALREI